MHARPALSLAAADPFLRPPLDPAPAARLTVCVHYKRVGVGGSKGRGGAVCVIALCVPPDECGQLYAAGPP